MSIQISNKPLIKIYVFDFVLPLVHLLLSPIHSPLVLLQVSLQLCSLLSRHVTALTSLFLTTVAPSILSISAQPITKIHNIY